MKIAPKTSKNYETTDNKTYMRKNTISEILNLLKISREIKSGNDKWITLGTIGKSEAKIIKEIIDVDVEGYNRIIDISSLKHIEKKHKELKDTDFCLIPIILENPDKITKGKHPESIVFRKDFEESYYYVEYVRNRRKKMALKTFYKTKKNPSKSN